MELNRILCRAVLTGLFIFSTPAAHLAHAGSNQARELASNDLTDLDRQMIEQLINGLHNPDARVTSAAAEKLGAYPYKEVHDALVTATTQLMRDHTKVKNFSFTVTAALKSLEQISTGKDAPAIRQLRDVFELNRYSNPVIINIAHHLDGYFSNIEYSASTRTTALPSLKAKADKKPAAAKDAATNANRATQSKAQASNQPRLNLKELLENVNPEAKARIEHNLLSSVEENLFDRSVRHANEGQFPEYFGREAELEKVAQALLRIEKGHVLLTGKAGVGKTTILKMLSDSWFQGKIPFRGSEPPIILELTITDVTNPQDPTIIKGRIAAAQLLAQALNRHVILFIDEAHISTAMTRNAIKNFLTKEIGTVDNRVQFVWATTSTESRTFLSDSAFSRRWVEIDITEFAIREAIETVKRSHIQKWRREHTRGNIAFTEISDEAFEFAAKYARTEQKHAGNPTGIKELLEGSIIYRMRELEREAQDKKSLSADERNFTLEVQDIRNYMSFQLGLKLIPGDKNFDAKFAEIWRQVEQDYVGNEGLLHSQRKLMYQHFAIMKPEKMLTQVLLGPPGGGKTYLANVISNRFFNTDALIINMAEYSEGGLSKNTLISSPSGTRDSDEPGRLIDYIRKNPLGGVVILDEADLGHKDILDLFVGMITNKQVSDGLGRVYNTERFLVYLTSNVGQDRMINREAKGKAISWEDVEMRRHAITTEIVVDGKRITVVRPDVTKTAFEDFVKKINQHSNPMADSTLAAQDGEKLKRRMHVHYVLPPTQEDLKEAARRLVNKWVQEVKLEHRITIKISDETVDRILDLKGYRFEEGFDYVNKQFDERLKALMTPYLSQRGQTLTVSVGTEKVPFGKRQLEGFTLQVEGSGMKQSHSLGVSMPASNNPWFMNDDITKRIQNFPIEMSKRIQGQDQQIATVYEMLRQKRLNWDSRIVFTQIGTSGNGKTEFGYSAAEALFGNRSAAFKISGIQHWGDLHNYFRSDTGFVGSNQETEFERWFMARKTLGGGVIILDELLSFAGMHREAIGSKIEAINKLYDMLDEGFIKFGSRKEDARGFIILITGNAMQELFDGIDDSPESEKLVRRILERVSKDDIAKYFRSLGIDAPKLARFGPIFVNGPLSRATSQAVGMKEVRRAIEDAIRETSQLYDVKVSVDPEIINEIVKRVSTVRMGMREVNGAIRTLVIQPVTGILSDLEGTSDIRATLKDGKIIWTADGAEAVREEMALGSAKISRWIEAKSAAKTARINTPQLVDVTEQPKVIVSEAQHLRTAIHEVYGHWMVDYLLTGKNNSETISLIPGDDHLGYVRPKDTLKAYTGPSLNSWLRQAAMLESGARATFIAGFYAGGGGTSGASRDPNKRRGDDLGRVDQIFDAMLSNQIFRRYTEFSNGMQKDRFKDFMRSVSKGMADRLIRYGLKTKQFQSVFNEVLNERFISETRIEELIQKVDRKTIASPEQLLMWAVSASTVQAVQKAKREGADVREIERLAKLGRELILKTSNEITAEMKLKGEKPGPWLGDTRAKGLGRLDQLSGVPNVAKGNQAVRCELLF